MRRLTPCLALAFATACGSTPSLKKPSSVTITQVSPSAPHGSVTGIVLDAKRAPIAGASVHLVDSDFAGDLKTDANGAFAFKNVPAGGTAFVTAMMDGYSTSLAAGPVPATAGNVPIDDGGLVVTMTLFQLSGTMSVAVIGSDGEKPAGLNVTAYYAFGSAIPNASPLVVTAAYQDGVASFATAPDPNDLLRYGIGATVAVNDPSGKYAGTAVTYSAGDIAGGKPLLITLPLAGDTGGPAQIVTSNVRDFMGLGLSTTSLVPSTGPVSVVFSRKIDPQTALAVVTDEDGSAVAVKTAITLNGLGLDITPTGASGFTAGAKYNCFFHVEAAGAISASVTEARSPFYVDLPNNPVVLRANNPTFKDNSGGSANNYLDPGEEVDFQLSQPIGVGSGRNFYVPVYVDGSNLPAGAPCTITNPCLAMSEEPGPTVTNPYMYQGGYTTHFRIPNWQGPQVPGGTTKLYVAFSQQMRLNEAGWIPWLVTDLDGNVLGADANPQNDPAGALTPAP